jgi:hypothetical protein
MRHQAGIEVNRETQLDDRTLQCESVIGIERRLEVSGTEGLVHRLVADRVVVRLVVEEHE